MYKLTREQENLSARNRYATGKLLNVPKGCVLHHVDENMRHENVERYIQWRPEDVVIMTKQEHMSLHQSGEKNINCRIPFTPERLKKMSEVMTGDKNPNWGKPRSEETKKKIGDSNRGKKRTEEYRKRMSEMMSGENHPFYGKKLPEEWRKHISEKKMGALNPMYGKVSPHAKKVKCLETSEVYNSLTEAAKKTGVSSTSIRRCCNGEFKQVKGFHFEFL